MKIIREMYSAEEGRMVDRALRTCPDTIWVMW